MRWLLLLAACLGCACDEARINLVSDQTAGARAAPDAGSTRPLDAAVASAPPDAAPPHIASARCGKRPCACDDGLDNDDDGLVDGLDPECTGSFDEDEASFGIGKSNKQTRCRDCFWDDNAGGGDDGCRYPSECLTGAAPGNNGNCSSCSVSSECIDTCRDRTPNGCDCFGCCEVARPDGSSLFIELAETCSLLLLDDANACPRCVRNTACLNPCGRCELCVGRRREQLPADCSAATGAPASFSCDDGRAVCSSSSDCVGASYCQLGCCLVDLL
jgi:hypothetical protein